MNDKEVKVFVIIIFTTYWLVKLDGGVILLHDVLEFLRKVGCSWSMEIIFLVYISFVPYGSVLTLVNCFGHESRPGLLPATH